MNEDDEPEVELSGEREGAPLDASNVPIIVTVSQVGHAAGGMSEVKQGRCVHVLVMRVWLLGTGTACTHSRVRVWSRSSAVLRACLLDFLVLCDDNQQLLYVLSRQSTLPAAWYNAVILTVTVSACLPACLLTRLLLMLPVTLPGGQPLSGRPGL
jgi:hypothetical protein